MKIQFQNFISPVNLKTPKITPVVSFGALECDKFEKSDSKKPSFEFCLGLFKRGLLVTNSDISKDKLSEVYAPLSFNEKELERFKNIITRPDYIEELKKINNEASKPEMRQKKENLLLSTIHAAKADDKTYSKMEPYLNSDKLNLPKYISTIYQMAQYKSYLQEFQRFQELMEDENIINLVNGGFMDGDYLRKMLVDMPQEASLKAQNALKSETIREIYKSGHLKDLNIEERDIKYIEAAFKNKNARELLLNGNLRINHLTTDLYGHNFEDALRLLENNNYANMLKQQNPVLNVFDSNMPSNALHMIWNDGRPDWYYENRPDLLPTDEEYRNNFEKILKLFENENIGFIISNFDVTFSDIFEMRNLSEDELSEIGKLHRVINDKKNNILKHPDLYVDGENTEELNAKNINMFFKTHRERLLEFLRYSDPETLEALLRLRFDSAKGELFEFDDFSEEKKLLFKKMTNCVDTNDNPFPPSTKIEFKHLIEAYKECGLSSIPINEMVNKGVIDFYKLNLNLFNRILTLCEFTEEQIKSIPQEKLSEWDMKNIYALSTEFDDDGDWMLFRDIMEETFLGDFKNFLHNESHFAGIANLKTKEIFEENGMDYSKWVEPSKDLNVQFKSTDKNSDRLIQIAKQVIEDVETLRKTSLKGVIDKRFKKQIIKDEFKIPNKCLSNKNEMETFVKNIIEQLNDVWTRAKRNLDNPNKAQSAKNTLTVLDHFYQRLEDIKQISDEKIEKPIDLTIKMWDRNPPHDLFQGNYSTCCIGMGRGNGSAMPYYLTNTVFNMIELVDNKTGETIGNALCYFAKVNGETSFVIDNIEINNAKQPSCQTGEKLKSAIVQYASNIAKSVTGKDNTLIYMGTSYNDVPTDNLKKEKQVFDIIGKLTGESNYIDLYGGWVEASDMKEQIEAFRLK